MAKTPLQGGNPGWAGELGEFTNLKEEDVRGSAYFANRPSEGIDAGGITAYPYQLDNHNPDGAIFEGPHRERLRKIIGRYPEKQGALLPALNLAHEVRGYLTPADMDQVARELELSPAYVRGVATFYTMYNRRPVGQYFIQVCTNVACNLCGADDILEAFCEHTGTEPGQLSPDGLFTVMEAECLGACGFPTAVQINERYFENVEVNRVPEIVASLRAAAKGLPPGRSSRSAFSSEIMETVEIAGENGHPPHEHGRSEVPK